MAANSLFGVRSTEGAETTPPPAGESESTTTLPSSPAAFPECDEKLIFLGAGASSDLALDSEPLRPLRPPLEPRESTYTTPRDFLPEELTVNDRGVVLVVTPGVTPISRRDASSVPATPSSRGRFSTFPRSSSSSSSFVNVNGGALRMSPRKASSEATASSTSSAPFACVFSRASFGTYA